MSYFIVAFLKYFDFHKNSSEINSLKSGYMKYITTDNCFHETVKPYSYIHNAMVIYKRYILTLCLTLYSLPLFGVFTLLVTNYIGPEKIQLMNHFSSVFLKF